jgi:hypothetical protein
MITWLGFIKSSIISAVKVIVPIAASCEEKYNRAGK